MVLSLAVGTLNGGVWLVIFHGRSGGWLAGVLFIACVLIILFSLFLFFRSPKKGHQNPPQRRGTRPLARTPLNLSSSRAKSLEADLTRRLQGDKASAQPGCPGKSEFGIGRKRSPSTIGTVVSKTG